MNKTSLITGASTGIGKALALEMARKGYDLGLIARRESLLNEVKAEIISRYPSVRVFVRACDVADDVSCREAVLGLAHDLGRLDICVANAGVGVPTPAWKINWDQIKQTLAVNVIGAIATLEAAKEVMLPQGNGQLVGISSVAGFRGLPTSSAYCTSKAALMTYLESIRVDLKPFRIAVTSIHPGFIATPMTAKNKFPMPFLMTAEQGARHILAAIEARVARYIFPWQVSILMAITRALPGWLFDRIVALAPRSGAFGKERALPPKTK